MASLRQIGEKWQKRLGLQEWEITWKALPVSSFGDDARTGEVVCESATLTAIITVAMCQAEVETTVLHELLHLMTDELSDAGHIASEALGVEAKAVCDAGIRRAGERLVRRLERLLGP